MTDQRMCCFGCLAVLVTLGAVVVIVLAATGQFKSDAEPVDLGTNWTKTDLYCFPDDGERLEWHGIWDKNYTLQVKEGRCGPGDNLFGPQGVMVNEETDELTLQFQYVDGAWTASEVRVVHPSGPFDQYGTFTFSVKSVIVKKVDTGEVVGDALPPSLILGLFTWDDSEDFATRENFNHEVDVEISQWDNSTDADAQFVVQPPEALETYRFWTGGEDTVKDQNRRTYGFTWNPNEITWFSNLQSGPGQSHTYTTLRALELGFDDHIQCMPANVEVRMNLWNLYGLVAPTDLAEDEMVEVVIDDFDYVPNGVLGAQVGEVCSKDCQCLSPALCVDLTCEMAS